MVDVTQVIHSQAKLPITDVFVDAAPELIGADKYEAQEFFEMISRASQATGVDFHFCIPDVSQSELEYSLVS